MTDLNVLWILCDELRTDALSCYGGSPVSVRTPSIDGLAGRGVLFERCYANSPVCVPARVSMHTGLLAEQTGVYHNEAYWDGYPMTRLDTFPEAFARAGWATADFGKEHVPRALKPWQLQDLRGSIAGEIFQAVDDDAVLYVLRSPGDRFAVAGRFPADVPYPPSAVVDHTLSWMASAPRPFLVRASLLQPHLPVIPPEPWASMYQDADWPDHHEVAPTSSAFERRFGEVSGGSTMAPADVVWAQAAYHGLVAWVDHEVGRLLAGLDALGIADRTAIVFTADHGRLLGEQGGIGKHTHAPASQRVPLIVSHPELAPARRNDLAQQVDLPHTFCGLADVERLRDAGGRDLFNDEAPERVHSTIGYGERESLAFPNIGFGSWYDDRGWPRRSCVRTDRWRYDRNVRIDGVPATGDDVDAFLADTLADPNEVVNLVADPEFAGVVSELSAALDDLGRDAVETPASVVYRTVASGTSA
jgi:arylsulfatase A-like enzyme